MYTQGGQFYIVKIVRKIDLSSYFIFFELFVQKVHYPVFHFWRSFDYTSVKVWNCDNRLTIMLHCVSRLNMEWYEPILTKRQFH